MEVEVFFLLRDTFSQVWMVRKKSNYEIYKRVGIHFPSTESLNRYNKFYLKIFFGFRAWCDCACTQGPKCKFTIRPLCHAYKHKIKNWDYSKILSSRCVLEFLWFFEPINSVSKMYRLGLGPYGMQPFKFHATRIKKKLWYSIWNLWLKNLLKMCFIPIAYLFLILVAILDTKFWFLNFLYHIWHL